MGARNSARRDTWLRRVGVRDFRNIRDAELDLPREGITVVGENGHGKTNLLEAIYYLELLRSVRGARDRDLVRFGQVGFHVAGTLAGPPERMVAVGFERAGRRKRARIDGSEPMRLSDAIGTLPAVLVSPRDVALVSGAPSERRRFLDIALALTSRRYLAALQSYRAALARRNAALREAAHGRHDDARVAIWEPPLAEHGAVIWEARVAWVEAQAGRFAALCEAIGERGVARLDYVTALTPGRRGAREALLEGLAGRRPHDLRRGMTLTGPHRDDLALTLADGEGPARDLRTFGSAGQQRTAAIALRLLEAETLRDHAGASPITLLDDPFAELDAHRSARVLELLVEGGLGQAVLAVPRPADIPAGLTSLQRWGVRDGAFEPERT